MKSTTQDTFAQDVLESKKIVLLDVWAPWCAPCRSMEPVVEDISKETADWADVVKLDASAEMDLVQALGISGLPTFLVYKNGQIVGSVDRVTPKATLVDLMTKALE